MSGWLAWHAHAKTSQPSSLFWQCQAALNLLVSIWAMICQISGQYQGRIQEFLKRGGGLYTIVVTFNANGVEREWRPRASGVSS